MTLWLGQNGYDYALRCDYMGPWEAEIAGIAEVCAHDPGRVISIEYMPNEPRSYTLLNDASATLLAIAEVGATNLGVTIDSTHSLHADERPAFAALIARKSKLLGLHLNDGYAERVDGLMIGSVDELATLELRHEAHQAGFDRAIYVDTFPDVSGLDPVAKCNGNIRTAHRLLAGVQALAATTARPMLNLPKTPSLPRTSRGLALQHRVKSC